MCVYTERAYSQHYVVKYYACVHSKLEIKNLIFFIYSLLIETNLFWGKGLCKEVNIPIRFSEEPLGSLELRYVAAKQPYFFPLLLWVCFWMSCIAMTRLIVISWACFEMCIEALWTLQFLWSTHFFLMTANWCVFSKTCMGVWPLLTRRS